MLTNAPRFSAYVASKAALDVVLRAARAAEFLDKGITFTTINMPLVRTPMIAPTKIYENVPTLSPEEAADLVVEAIVHKPVRIATRLGIFGAVLHAIAPQLTQMVMNTAFHMFPDSAAAQGKKDEASRSSCRPSRWPSRHLRRAFTGSGASGEPGPRPKARGSERTRVDA